MSNWPFPFAEANGGHLTARRWILVCVAAVAIHVGALEAGKRIGVFRTTFNTDHAPYVWEVLERGYPSPRRAPPGYAYYLALKWRTTEALDLPYWTSKYLFDTWLVMASGALSVLLAASLTRNGKIALVSGLCMVGAPIFVLGVGYELSVILFQPLFLLSLLLVVRELVDREPPRVGRFALAGLVMGVATLVRANPQFLILVLGPFLVWVGARKPGASKTSYALLAGVFVICQMLPLIPWSLAQRRAQMSALTPFSGVYNVYYEGIRLHPGNRVADWLIEHRDQNESLAGVVRFNLRWLREDPVALAKLYVLKLVRAWYMSRSGRWDGAILALHAPLWVLSLWGWWRWRRLSRGDPAYIFLLSVIGYMWAVSAIMAGLARYAAPLYGFIGVFVGVALLPWLDRQRSGSGRGAGLEYEPVGL